MGFETFKSNLENLLAGATVAPTMVYSGAKQNYALKHPEKYHQEEEKKPVEKKKEVVQEQAKEKEVKVSDPVIVTKNDKPIGFKRTIRIESSKDDDSVALKMIKKKKAADDLLAFVEYYISNSNAELQPLAKLEREIVNSLAKIYGCKKIYPEDGYASLGRYLLGKESYDPEGKYLLFIDVIKDRKNSDFKNNILKERKIGFKQQEVKTKEEIIVVENAKEEPKKETQETFSGIMWKTDINGIVHPIIIGEKKEVEPEEEIIEPIVIPEEEVVASKVIDVNNKRNDLPSKLYKKLEKTIGKYLQDMDYSYTMRYDLVDLRITRDNGKIDLYMLDPGIVSGKAKIHILGNFGPGTIFVPIDENFEDLVKNILSSINYVMSTDEYQKVIDQQFTNQNIYRYIDLNKTYFLDKLSRDNFKKIGKKLTFIINTMKSKCQPGIEAPRLRFLRYGNIDDFSLISDNQVKSPLVHEGVTSPQIVPGLLFTVNGDDILENYNGQITKYHIEKYGDM